jgi:hypothetical protein
MFLMLSILFYIYYIRLTIDDQRYAIPAPDDGKLESQDWKDLATGQSVAFTGKMALYKTSTIIW